MVGAAGTGKTAALAAAREAWEAGRYHAIGCALAARAAAELTKGSGIAACTIDRLLASTADAGRLPDRSVLVVDEAAMVGTRQLARLLELAETSAAKVVLVGDHRQLPEIAAGGAFAALAQRLGPVTLRRNRRQVQRWNAMPWPPCATATPKPRSIATSRPAGCTSALTPQACTPRWWRTGGPVASAARRS